MELQIRVRRSGQAVRKEPEGAAVLHPAQSKYKIILISDLLQERSLRNKPACCLFYFFFQPTLDDMQRGICTSYNI